MAPQLEALPESPPATLRGSTFAEAFDKAAEDIKTKYDSFPIKSRSSFNPNFAQTMPARRKTKTERLVSSSKSLFRTKAQRKSRNRGSDRHSSATLEPQAASTPKASPPSSPNWVPMLHSKQLPEQLITAELGSGGKLDEIPPEEPESPQKGRVVSFSMDIQPLKPPGAIYLPATSVEEEKLAEDMKRRQAKLESLRNWPFESCSDEVPNTAESSTEECPFLVTEPSSASNPTAEELQTPTVNEQWEEHSESFYAQLEAIKEARDSLDVENQAPKEPKIMPVPFDQDTAATLPLLELDSTKEDGSEYQESLDGTDKKWREAVQETVNDIQEPTSTFTYIPIASTDLVDGADETGKHRAEIAAAISSRRAATNPFSSPLDAYFEGGELVPGMQVPSESVSNISTAGSLASVKTTSEVEEV